MTHGGKRNGSGRKVKPPVVVKKVMAEEILASIDEKAAWQELLSATIITSVVVISGEEGQRENITVPDWRTRADALKYLTNRRDGMPPQSIQHSTDDDKPFRLVIQYVGRPDNQVSAQTN